MTMPIAAIDWYFSIALASSSRTTCWTRRSSDSFTGSVAWPVSKPAA
jgi:hypothetical protein